LFLFVCLFLFHLLITLCLQAKADALINGTTAYAAEPGPKRLKPDDKAVEQVLIEDTSQEIPPADFYKKKSLPAQPVKLPAKPSGLLVNLKIPFDQFYFLTLQQSRVKKRPQRLHACLCFLMKK
jgi:hypothetical protein